MPETEDWGSGAPPAPESGRRRRRRRRPLLVRYWWVAPLLVFLFLSPAIWGWLKRPHFRPDPLPGYISDTGRLEQEYLQYTGKPLPEGEPVRDFRHANGLMLAGSYPNAALLLEGVSKAIAVPLVFHDLGLLYAKINDGEHAVRAFRDALARDHGYGPALASIKTLKLNVTADPGSSELEPNNGIKQSNVVWMDRPIDGVIGANSSDVDDYWFTVPRPPRDRVAIEVLCKSPTLTPHLLLYDSNGQTVVAVRQASSPGSNVRFDFAPPANSSFYVQISGVGASYGAYTLSVSSLKAYDVYEPNDDILNPTRISLGQAVEANVMDADDTDFYSFASSSAGQVTVDIVGHAPDIELRLTTFAQDLHNTGFGPDVEPGKPIHYAFPVEANRNYFLQVWTKSNTSGPYSMIVRQETGSEAAPAEETPAKARKSRRRPK